MLIQEASIPVFVTATKWIVIIFYFLIFLKILYILRILKYKDAKKDINSGGEEGNRRINDPNDPHYYKRELINKIKKVKKETSAAKKLVNKNKKIKSQAKNDLKTSINEAKYKTKKVESLLHKAKASQIAELERIIQESRTELRLKKGLFEKSLATGSDAIKRKKLVDKVTNAQERLTKARALYKLARIKNLKSKQRLKNAIILLKRVIIKIARKIKS